MGKRTAVLTLAVVVAIAATVIFNRGAIVSYNENMTWSNGVLDINLHNKTNKVLRVAVATPYFTTEALSVEPKSTLNEFPIENLFIDSVSDVLVVCDGYGEEKTYNARVTIAE
jgi:hypothetical protein